MWYIDLIHIDRVMTGEARSSFGLGMGPRGAPWGPVASGSYIFASSTTYIIIITHHIMTQQYSSLDYIDMGTYRHGWCDSDYSSFNLGPGLQKYA